MLLGIIVGVALGYFFKPQLDEVVVRVIKKVKESKVKVRSKDDEHDQ